MEDLICQCNCIPCYPTLNAFLFGNRGGTSNNSTDTSAHRATEVDRISKYCPFTWILSSLSRTFTCFLKGKDNLTRFWDYVFIQYFTQFFENDVRISFDYERTKIKEAKSIFLTEFLYPSNLVTYPYECVHVHVQLVKSMSRT